MAIDIDVLNLERSITALGVVLRETSDRGELVRESLATIAESLEWVESMADSLERIMAAVELLAQQPKRAGRRPVKSPASRRRKGDLKAVGS